MKRLRNYVEARGLRVEILSGPDANTDEYNWQYHAYTLKLTNGELGTKMTIPWRQGIGITDDPSDRPELVFECLIIDAWGYLQAQSFEDWAGEYGYDTDSRKAEQMYRELEARTTAFLDFIGGKAELENLALNYEKL